MFNAFFKQYILVCSISVDNHSRRKQFTQCFTAFIIFFNDLNTDAHVEKLFRKIIGNRAPANDQSILYLVRFDTGLFKKITCFRRRSHNTDHIIFFKHKITIRDYNVFAAFNSTDLDICFDLFCNITQ